MGSPLLSVLRNVSGARAKAQAQGDDVTRVSVMVARDADAGLLRALREGFYPQTCGARVHVEAFGDADEPVANALSDAAVIACAGDVAPRGAGVAARLWRTYATAGVPAVVCARVAPAPKPGAVVAGAPRGAHPLRDALVADGVSPDAIVTGGDPGRVVARVGAWVVRALGDDEALAAATGFPCCREAQARALIERAARDNAVASLLGVLPGAQADRVALTTNQAVLALRVAKVYGHPVGAERLREIVPIIASSRLWRGVARALERRLPLPPVVVRALVAAAATAAEGATVHEALRGTATGARDDAREPHAQTSRASRGRRSEA